MFCWCFFYRPVCEACALLSVLCLGISSLGRHLPHFAFRARYNATSPPIYDLSAFGANHTKLVVYQGSNDHLADPEDVQVRAIPFAMMPVAPSPPARWRLSIVYSPRVLLSCPATSVDSYPVGICWRIAGNPCVVGVLTVSPFRVRLSS